jgi:uncharacterized protein
VTAAPQDEGSRLAVIDAIRGFALFGIFLINLDAFTGFDGMTPDERAALSTAAIDGPVRFVLIWLAMGKFYSLFSLLFGLGFSLQMDAAAREGDVTLRRFRRRLLVLLAFGCIHLAFWHYDILTLYALLGFVLIAFRRWDNRTLVAASVVLTLTPIFSRLRSICLAACSTPERLFSRSGSKLMPPWGSLRTLGQ